MRIISLLSGATELVAALGMGEHLVGRSHECDFPEWVKRLPVCTGPTFDVSGTSLEIDGHVRDMLRQGQPLYRVEGQLLAQLAPDVVIAQAHCEVCAAGPEDIRRASCDSPVPMTARVAELTAGNLGEMFEAFIRVARAIDCEERGRQFVTQLRSRLDGITRAIRGLRQPSVECLEWIDPVFPMGNWSPELVAIAGGMTHLGAPGKHSAATEWERVREVDPEFLIIAPCGFDLARTRLEMPTMQRRPGWRQLRAVRTGQVFLADGNRYFNRSGPSVVETAEIIAQILHPTVFPPAHRDRAWEIYGDDESVQVAGRSSGVSGSSVPTM
jgi:iron complex transport system substrate-binding protein